MVRKSHFRTKWSDLNKHSWRFTSSLNIKDTSETLTSLTGHILWAVRSENQDSFKQIHLKLIKVLMYTFQILRPNSRQQTEFSRNMSQQPPIKWHWEKTKLLQYHLAEESEKPEASTAEMQPVLFSKKNLLFSWRRFHHVTEALFD